MTISNCGHDERNQYRGGKAGDQTGGEYTVKAWYDRPWDVVLRPETAEIGSMLAKIAKQAAQNNKIGYDQSQRKTYFEQLKKANWHPENIKTACEADCSSSTAANIIATGFRLDIDKLKVSSDLWTGNMKAALQRAGFEALTGRKYRTSPKYLLPGDVLLNESHHVAINLTAGEHAGKERYKNGSERLLVIDGWFGFDTTCETQRFCGTTVDGEVSNQAESDRKALPRAVKGVWIFYEGGRGKGSDMIRALQKIFGMPKEERDGFAGTKTVKAWQRFLDIAVTGKLDEATVKAWQRYLNAHKKK